MGLGWLQGHGREAGAPSLAHSSWEQLWQLCPLTWDRGQRRCRFNITPHCQPRPGPGARSELGGTGRLQREQDPGCARSSPLLRAGRHERPGTEQQQFPTARQEHHGHTHGTGQAGHPPPATSQRTPAGRNGSAQCLWRGMRSCQGTEWPLRHLRPLWGPHRCEGPAVQDGGCGVGRALPRHRALPPSPQPLLLCWGYTSDHHHTAQPWAAGTILGRSKAPKASLGWLRTAEQGKGGGHGDAMTQHRIGAEVLQSGRATAGEGSVRTPGSKRSPSTSQEPVAQADPSLQLSPPWHNCSAAREGQGLSSPSPEPPGQDGREGPLTAAALLHHMKRSAGRMLLKNRCQHNSFPLVWVLWAPKCLLTNLAMPTTKQRDRLEEGVRRGERTLLP